VSDCWLAFKAKRKPSEPFRPLQEQISVGMDRKLLIDFDRRELLGVEESISRLKFLGVKTSLPLFIRVSEVPTRSWPR